MRDDLPLVREISPPPDPWEAFLSLSGLPFRLFFDSAAADPVRGRYSYLAASPFEVLTARKTEARAWRPASAELLERGGAFVESGLDPFELVSERLLPWSAPEIDGLPPFQGGAAGIFGYGLSRWVEKLPRLARDEFETPDLVLGLYDWVLAFDHERGTCHLVAHGFPEATEEGRSARAERRSAEVMGLLRRGPQPSAPEPGGTLRPALGRHELARGSPIPGPEGLLSNFSRDGYVRAVERAIEYIRAGDIFQVNLSQRLLFPLRTSPVELYRRLRKRNPAPFAGYMDADEMVIASSSPEQFLSLAHGQVITRPIKGTRPRGYTPEADAYSPEALRESDKDRAENVMIVDLLRNDLSRVAKPHTVKVPRLFEVERHPTVHHLVSEVRAELRDGLGALDVLRAAFPGGSITGAPKVRAMEIIAELEPTARGPYCGSLAWIAFHGGMSSSILIRTMTLARGWIQFPVGGGIVAPSNPAVEYQETLDKAEGMVRALVE
jgi:para-aminobenzoate synthetase component 1